MEQQNATSDKTQTEIINAPIPYSQLSYIQRAYIDWRALNGLITDEDGIRKMTLSDLAKELKVERSTIYRAIEKIPNLWDLINDRLKEIAPRSRLARVREIWYIKAAKGEFQHLQLWLANFDPDFRMPTQKHEHDASGGLADVLRIAKERMQQQLPEPPKAIESEVVDGPPDN